MSLIAHQTKQRITRQFADHVSSGKVEFYKKVGIDFVMGEREGIYIYDLDGKRLINCHSNGGVFNLGHRNPKVIKAVQRALDELDIGNHHLVSEARAALATRLAKICPGDINHVVFGVSGGEAIDMAIKLARAHTMRTGIISAIGGYHGHTGLALAAGDEQYRHPFEPLSPGFTQVPFGDIEALEKVVDNNTAGIMFETIPATSGIVIPPEDYFREVRALCDRTGAIMIMDEVQTGLGRTGEVWGIDTYEVVPDIIVTGKGLSGGIYPITATLYREFLNPFAHDNPFIHISTFGGSEIGCHAAIEVLNILEDPSFLPHIHFMSELFEDGFKEFQENHPEIVHEVHQRGLMMGLKLGAEQLGPLFTQISYEMGLLVVYANNDPSAVQILPPLIIQPHEVDLILKALDGVLSQMKIMVATA